MAPTFGTSGLRGLVSDLTPDLVSDYIRAFLSACPVGTGLHIGHDLRASSPDLAGVVADTARAEGHDVTFCGPVPTPALALAAMQAGAGAVMITGSHIPADRNGLKFYTPQGEITKDHEAAILAARGQPPGSGQGRLAPLDAGLAYAARYRAAYGNALSGLRLGLYAQSAVGRDLMLALLRDLGAEVTELGRAGHFIPVDTEAVSDDLRADLRGWAGAHDFDAIISTDADGDRPLLADARGEVIPGDVLGQITGAALGAEVAVTPVSSNSGAEQVFDRVIRTRIGSPFVIAGMEAARGRVVGYEANGGFLLGFDAMGPAGELPQLATRDAVLPLIAVLAHALTAGSVAALRATQPDRYTASDRLVGIPTADSQALIATMKTGTGDRAGFLDSLDLQEAATDQTDGLRITATDGQVVHLRPSGNAPELRLYTESDSPARATALLAAGLNALRSKLDAAP